MTHNTTQPAPLKAPPPWPWPGSLPAAPRRGPRAESRKTRQGTAARLSRMAHRSIDPGGRAIVRVPLAHSKVTGKNPRRFAVLDAEDFDRLMAAGVSPCWTLNKDGKLGIGYVRAAWGSDPRGRTLVSIAPLVLGTEPGQRVHYRDRDRLNLRRANLWAE